MILFLYTIHSSIANPKRSSTHYPSAQRNMQSSNAPLPTQTYEIHVQEDLDDDLAAWFNPLLVKYAPDGRTVLTVKVRDQAELHGLLIKIRDLNLTLIALINKELYN